MSSRALRRLTATVALAAVSAWAGRARASCEPARSEQPTSSLPRQWRVAVDDLVRSSAEPGHPWSCSGGTVEIALASSGARLRIARAGELPIERVVHSPEDVVPLGQALLSAPLAPPPSSSTFEDATSAPVSIETARPIATDPPPASDERTPTEPHAAPSATTKSTRVILGGGVDARAVGRSNVAWMGPTLSAGIPVGLWLPSLSVRYQSTVGADGPPLEEASAALAVQARFPIRALELRTGVALRGGAVFRDLPRPRGEQSELQGRAGIVATLSVPLPRWVNLLVALDADVVVLSRQTAVPSTTATDTSTAFPAYTIGGTLGIELPL